jgi:hypothetical protein
MYSANFTIIDGDINLRKLIEELADTSDVPDPIEIAFANNNTLLQISFADTLSAEEETALNTLIAEHDPETLEELKQRRIVEIDTRTTEIVAEGFEYNGLVFSGSLEAQSRIMGAVMGKDNPAAYPMRWMTKDDKAYIDITDAAMLVEFFATGFMTLKTKITVGSNLKIAINDANSEEEVNSITDPR